jgi:hypothetical protein
MRWVSGYRRCGGCQDTEDAVGVQPGEEHEPQEEGTSLWDRVAVAGTVMF